MNGDSSKQAPDRPPRRAARRWRRTWKRILALVVAFGAIVTLLGQIRQVGEWYGKTWSRSAAVVWSKLIQIDAVRFRRAEAVAREYHQNDVCVVEVALVDLDRNGLETDLVVRYMDRRKLVTSDQTLTCAELRQDPLGAGSSAGQLLMVAQNDGWHHRPLHALQLRQGTRILPLGTLFAATFFETDFPESTIYGLQKGQLTELATYNHMLEFGPGDDEEVEIFDAMRAGTGAQIRAAEGFFEIEWNDAAQRFDVVPLGWRDLVKNSQVVLHVDRSNEQDPVLMLNDRAIDIKEDGTAVAEVNSLARIAFEPQCIPREGFKQLPNSLGAVVLDPLSSEHTLWCILSTEKSITLKVVPQ